MLLVSSRTDLRRCSICSAAVLLCCVSTLIGAQSESDDLERVNVAIEQCRADLSLLAASSYHEADAEIATLGVGLTGTQSRSPTGRQPPTAKALDEPRTVSGRYQYAVKGSTARITFLPGNTVHRLESGRSLARGDSYYADGRSLFAVDRDGKPRWIDERKSMVDLLAGDALVLFPDFVGEYLLEAPWSGRYWYGPEVVQGTASVRRLADAEVAAISMRAEAGDVVVRRTLAFPELVTRAGPLEFAHVVKYQAASGMRPVEMLEIRNGLVRSRWTMRWQPWDKGGVNWLPTYIERRQFWPGEGPDGTDIESHRLWAKLDTASVVVGDVPAPFDLRPPSGVGQRIPVRTAETDGMLPRRSPNPEILADGSSGSPRVSAMGVFVMAMLTLPIYWLIRRLMRRTIAKQAGG